MKNVLVSGLAVAALAVITAPATFAQNTLMGTVPFAFEINKHTVLPAGSYAVMRQGTYWVFRGNDAHVSGVVSGVPKNSYRDDEPRLVFNCHADRCQLREIQIGGGGTGYLVPKEWLRKDSDELARVVVVKLSHSAD